MITNRRLERRVPPFLRLVGFFMFSLCLIGSLSMFAWIFVLQVGTGTSICSYWLTDWGIMHWNDVNYFGTYCYDDFAGYATFLLWHQIVMIAVSPFVVALSLIGLTATKRGKWKILKWISLGSFLIFLMVSGLSLGSGFFFWNEMPQNAHDEIEGKVRASMRESMKLNKEYHDKHRLIWDNMQATFCCCGVDGPDDWKSLDPLSFPASCVCHVRNGSRCDMGVTHAPKQACQEIVRMRDVNGHYYVESPSQGCLGVILSEISVKYVHVQRIGAVSLFLIGLSQILGVLAPFVMYCIDALNCAPLDLFE